MKLIFPQQTKETKTNRRRTCDFLGGANRGSWLRIHKKKQRKKSSLHRRTKKRRQTREKSKKYLRCFLVAKKRGFQLRFHKTNKEKKSNLHPRTKKQRQTREKSNIYLRIFSVAQMGAKISFCTNENEIRNLGLGNWVVAYDVISFNYPKAFSNKKIWIPAKILKYLRPRSELKTAQFHLKIRALKIYFLLINFPRSYGPKKNQSLFLTEIEIDKWRIFLTFPTHFI